MRNLFLIFAVGFVATLALYAATAAHGQSNLELVRPCTNNTAIPCKYGPSVTNTVLICLRDQRRNDEGCPVGFSVVEMVRHPPVQLMHR
jgi:hypothetical protein